MTDFLEPGVLNDTLQATYKWRGLFSDLGSFANDMTLSHDPSAFGGEGGDILTMTVEGVEIEAAEWASSDIRFSATFPNGSSIYGGETVFEETDGRSGLFGLKRVSEPVVEARSALNALLVLATMKAIRTPLRTEPGTRSAKWEESTPRLANCPISTKAEVGHLTLPPSWSPEPSQQRRFPQPQTRSALNERL